MISKDQIEEIRHRLLDYALVGDECYPQEQMSADLALVLDELEKLHIMDRFYQMRNLMRELPKAENEKQV